MYNFICLLSYNMNTTWVNDYNSYKADYSDFQKDVLDFVEACKGEKAATIDIHRVDGRPKDEIKTIESIEANIQNGKYDRIKTIFKIRDIAGVRVTCHCIEDLSSFADYLLNRVRYKYKNGERKNHDKLNDPYKAVHITVSREVIRGKKRVNIICEIQLRTVMGNAWAVQDHKYKYKSGQQEGDTDILTQALSEIMQSCEKLWTLMKHKNKENDDQILKSK